MRVKLSHIEVEGTPDELDWFGARDQDHLRMSLAQLNYGLIAGSSMAVMPEIPADADSDPEDGRVLVVHRGGKPQPPPEGEDDQ